MVPAEPRLRPLRFLPMRLLVQIDVDESSFCLLWTGDVTRQGRPRVWNGQKLVFLYRWVVEGVTGKPIPKRMTVGHTCHDRELNCPTGVWADWCWHRRCVEPTHLAIQSLRDNILASPRTIASLNRGAAMARLQLAEGSS